MYQDTKTIARWSEAMRTQTTMNPMLYDTYGVKRGLRDKNGKGVLAGLTSISQVQGKKLVDGKELPCEGRLFYRGYSIFDLVRGESTRRHCLAEECAYLLLFGSLPTEQQLQEFSDALAQNRTLPQNFTRDVIMKAPSSDVMNTLTRSVLTLSAYDAQALDNSLPNVLRQSLVLIGTLPLMSVYGYHAYHHYCQDGSFYIHHPVENLTMAENLLMMLRPDRQFSALEAQVLDLALVLHMEHGGGNNSTFTTLVVTSLKGAKHGGANLKVVGMMDDLRARVSDTADRDQVERYLTRVLHGEEFDHTGLIYGMGHAVYSLSDPRAVIFKSFVKRLAQEKGRLEEYQLYETVEQLAPEIISRERRIYKGVCANVDFYSGFVYRMLDIPQELFTPIFAVARMVGWSAHRMEELINTDKIIRPAYQSVCPQRAYVPLEER